MAAEILMPRQGNSVETCIINSWLKKEGDSVSKGDIICEVETDKASFEVEAEEAGILLKILHEEGDEVPVLQPIAIVGSQGEDISSLIKNKQSDENKDDKADKNQAAVVQAAANTAAVPSLRVDARENAFISPRAKNLAEEKGLDYSNLAGSGPEGRIIERDIQNALAQRQPLSAAAKSAASGKTVPAQGSGIGGRVTLADLSSGSVEAPALSQDAAENFPGEIEETKIKGVRKLIAERMKASLLETAQLTLNSSACAEGILFYRKKCKQAPEELGVNKITIGDLVLFAVAKTLPSFPEMNVLFENETIKKYKEVHLAVAVDTERGLMVPVIRSAQRKSLKALSLGMKDLAAQCQSGKINPDLLNGGTFTVSNLGNFGIESFTPVLNPPQAAILGVCSIQQKPLASADGCCMMKPYIGLSLTINHQIVDGAPAARFLKALSQAIENIDLILAG